MGANIVLQDFRFVDASWTGSEHPTWCELLPGFVGEQAEPIIRIATARAYRLRLQMPPAVVPLTQAHIDAFAAEEGEAALAQEIAVRRGQHLKACADNKAPDAVCRCAAIVAHNNTLTRTDTRYRLVCITTEYTL